MSIPPRSECIRFGKVPVERSRDPFSASYAEQPVTSVVRLCFAKHPETLEAALERLAAARSLFDR